MTDDNSRVSFARGYYGRYSDMEIVELPMFPYEMKSLERLKEVKN
ncbi:hypothetical protein ACFLUY_03745 [Chloroflexota bacterium]